MKPEPLRLLLIGSLPPRATGTSPPSMPIGGTTVSFGQLVAELRQRNDVEVEVSDTLRSEPGRVWARLRAAASVAGRLPAAVARADVVTFHASTPGTVWFGPPLYFLCRLLRRPLVLREFGGSLDADYAQLGRLPRALARIALRADRVLLQTQSLVESFRREIPDGRFAWYSNSRPLPAEPARLRPGNPRRFVFVGHVKPNKGIRVLLEAVQALPDGCCTVDVYGPFLDGMSERDFAGVSHVAYRGTLAPEAVVPVLAGYDAVLLPTYHPGEGYPGIILESYAAGRPVIATRWRSIPEIVDEDVSGLLVAPRDARDLARALAELVRDDAKLLRLADGARASAQRFSSSRWTQAFVDVCREVVRERERPLLTGPESRR